MNIIYENENCQYHALILPQHKRTLIFNNQPKLVEIPKSIVIAYYDKEKKCIRDGFVCDFELNYKLNFGNQFCSNGRTFKNINDYISWYWNSKFEKNCGKHRKIHFEWFRKCWFPYYSLAKLYQPNKLKTWKNQDQLHIKNCEICKEKL